jgi:uncharacterized membrane-anchored protein
MNLKTLFFQLFIAMSVCANAAPPEDSTAIYQERYKKFADSLNKTLKYKTGKIGLEGGHAALDIPAGFKYLNKEQSNYVLTELWGNPATSVEGVLGMIFPEGSDPFKDSSYAFVITYSEIGYVKDDDASDINYDELLKNLKEDEKTENIERMKAGYEPVYIIGWAQKPFYDEKRKILHWAKELRFGDGENEHTLNYEVRILGRKGMLSLNAVSSINELSLVNKDISKILNIASFTEGNAYSDFNPDVDEVAAWTIGGLVAGKLLAKAGLLAVILKFLAPIWKFLLIALVPIGAWIKRRFTSRKPQEEYAPVSVQPEESSENNTTPQ